MMAVNHSVFAVVVLVMAAMLSSRARSQALFPYIQLGQILRNNSVIDLSLLGSSDNIVCMTDLNTCCSDVEGMAGRVWYLPNGTKLFQDGVREINAFTVHASAQQFVLVLQDLTARSNRALSGIYECSIDTNTEPRQSVYVGMYYQPVKGRIYMISLV